MGWRNRPKHIDYCPKDVDYVMFIDENGDCDLKYLKRCLKNQKNIDENSIYFTITGVIIEKNNLKGVKDGILGIKLRNWEDGYFEYENCNKKRVCLHSREIRRKEGPFRDGIIARSNFLEELTHTMEDIPCTIISSTIDKLKHVKQYNDHALHPYNLCLNFVLERFVKFYLDDNKKGIIILESRGKKEDMEILNHIKGVIATGTSYVHKNYFKKIKGVYFNTKWQKSSHCKKSYFGLEIADLFSYPIHKYCKLDKKDNAFKTLQNKIYKYPNYKGCGIKIFPK